MDRAVERIRQAIARREPIEIHGDYDVDGVTSTVVLKKALELAGADIGLAHSASPARWLGMQPAAVEEAAARGVAWLSAWITAFVPEPRSRAE